MSLLVLILLILLWLPLGWGNLEIQQFSGYALGWRMAVTLAIYVIVFAAIWVRPKTVDPEQPPKSSISQQASTAKGDVYQVAGDLIQNKMPAPQMAPQVEGMRYTVRQVPSRDSATPYSWEITIQVESEVSQFGAYVVCDKPIKGRYELINFTGMATINGEGPMVNSRNPGVAVPESYGFRVLSPAISPRQPLAIIVSSKEPFKILEVGRW